MTTSDKNLSIYRNATKDPGKALLDVLEVLEKKVEAETLAKFSKLEADHKLELKTLMGNHCDEIRALLDEKVNNFDKLIKHIRGDDGESVFVDEVVDELIDTPEFLKLVKGDKGDSVKGDPGKNYVLTAADKKDIAKGIKPKVLKQIIEKTIVEKPIVTEIENKDEPIEVANKLNTLEEKVDRGVIKGLVKWMKNIEASLRDRKGGGSGGGGGMGMPMHEIFSVSTSTTFITLSRKIAAAGNAIIALRYQGQVQDMTTHYTVAADHKTINFTGSLVFQDDSFISITYIRG